MNEISYTAVFDGASGSDAEHGKSFERGWKEQVTSTDPSPRTFSKADFSRFAEVPTAMFSVESKPGTRKLKYPSKARIPSVCFSNTGDLAVSHHSTRYWETSSPPSFSGLSHEMKRL